MHLFYFFSFIPLTVFTLTLWWDIRGREEYRKRDAFLLVSVITMAVTGFLMIPILVFAARLTPSAELFFFQAITVLNYSAFFFLEYSVHVRRIENSYYAGEFRTGLALIRILLIAGFAVVAAAAAVAVGEARGFIDRTAVPQLMTGTILLLLGWMITVFVVQIRKVFNLPAGIIRMKRYPFIVLFVATFASVLFQWLQLIAVHRITFSYLPYIGLNITFILRSYMEYLFYRTYHLQKRIRDQEKQRTVQNDLAAQVISSSEADDVKIIRSVVQSALDEMNEAVVVGEHTFKGVMVFRRSGDQIRIESQDLIFGYCTPLHQVENIKRMNRDQLVELLLMQTYGYANLTAVPGTQENFGTAAIRKMLETRSPVSIDPIPGCYHGLHELIYLVPVSSRKDFEGFLVLFKDSFASVFAEEERILAAMTDSLSLIFQLKKGKDVQLERNRLQGEMEIARNIQTSIVPAVFSIPGYTCACSMRTATEVGGDAYDLVQSGEKHYIGIGDVAGHGLPAGIMSLIQMSAFHAAVMSSETLGSDLEIFQIYEIVNKVLCRINRDRIGSDKFMTQNYFVEKDGRFSVSGTHLVALRYSKKEDLVVEMTECVNRTGFLGLSEFISAKPSQSEFSMEGGDMLLLYTDGVIEAKNSDSEQFGMERLKRIVRQIKDGTPDALVGEIQAQLQSFAQAGDLKKYSGKFADDITLVAIRKD